MRASWSSSESRRRPERVRWGPSLPSCSLGGTQEHRLCHRAERGRGMQASASTVERRRLPWARFAVVLLLVVLDLTTKSALFGWLDSSPPPEELVRDQHGHLRYPLLGDWLALMASENPGAAFGRFGDWPRALVLGRVAAVVFLLVALWRAKRAHPLLLSGMVLVLAGAVGNLYDNLFREPPPGRPF